MGETQLYSQRLHGINEKRRILSEVDQIQRELELQKLKLQQLKRKSLRDRWLMEGLVPAPGIETENPLSQTEDTIHNLELELENLQSQLVHLENPELSTAKAKKIQEITQDKHLANGDENRQAADHKEIHEEKKSDSEPPHNSQKEKPTTELVDPSQKDPTQGMGRQVGQPIPAPRGVKIQGNHQEENKSHEELSKLNELSQNLNQNSEHPDQKGQDEHHESHKEENEIQNINHTRVHEDQKEEHLDQDGKREDQPLGQEHFDKNQPINHQNVESHSSLRHEKQNLEDLAQGCGNEDINVHIEGDKSDISLPSTAKEDKSSHHQNDSVALSGTGTNVEIFGDQNENESTIENTTQPALPTVGQQQDHELPLTDSDKKNDEDMNVKVVLESAIHDQNQDQNVELLKDQDKGSTCPADDPKQNQLSAFHDQTLDLLPISNDQGLKLPTEAQVKVTTIPSKDQDLNVSPPDEDQKQSSQVIVITTPGLDQHSPNLQPGPSASHQTSAVVTNTPAECQPLLHKTQETDASRQPHGTNTAETRDRDTPAKKKTCECCVVM